MRKKNPLVFAVSLAFLLPLLGAGCSLDYSGTLVADELGETVPDTVLTDFLHVAVRGDVETFRIRADRGENYNKKKESHFFGVEFTEYDARGEVLTRGNCDRALLYMDTDNVELWGNLSFYSVEEEALVRGEYLFWEDAKGELRGAEDRPVSIQLDSGTRISGTGFAARGPDRAVSFASGVSGVWVDEGEGGEPAGEDGGADGAAGAVSSAGAAGGDR